jgi:putative transposase
MQKVSTAYAMYINKKYQRTGALFEGPFKAKHVTSDRYLKYLFAYIHLNPIPRQKIPRRGLGTTDVLYKQALDYRYSSLSDYVDGRRDEAMILQTEMFPMYHATKTAWRNELEEWIEFNDDK